MDISRSISRSTVGFAGAALVGAAALTALGAGSAQAAPAAPTGGVVASVPFVSSVVAPSGAGAQAPAPARTQNSSRVGALVAGIPFGVPLPGLF